MGEFERDGSGSSHRSEATHTRHKALTHAVGVGTQLWDRDATQGLLSRMSLPDPGQSSRAKRRGEERPIRAPPTAAFITGATGGERLLREGAQLCNYHDIRAVRPCSGHAHSHACCRECVPHASAVNN